MTKSEEEIVISGRFEKCINEDESKEADHHS